MATRQPQDPFERSLAASRSDSPAFEAAWVGMEPTFQSAKAVKKWRRLAAEEGGEDAYFLDDYMLGMQRRIAKHLEARYEKKRAKGADCGCFAKVRRDEDVDPWNTKRQNLAFSLTKRGAEALKVRVTLDPETFEYSIKPVPLAWFEDERFVAFLEELVWKVPHQLGLRASIAHGGCQFSLSAKTFLKGSLLADDLADKLNHPELSTFLLDWPNPDDRAFRATTARFGAFTQMLDAYRRGAFHPEAKGLLTVENAYGDRGFEPAAHAKKGLMDRTGSPTGDARAVFQTNFGFGRAVRLFAQAVDPGYWQAAHPKEDGYRPDQIMRYGEANLNRLQIRGEWHVKRGNPLEVEDAPPYDAPLDASMLAREASYENRAQMGRTSARDFVEALFLSVNRARHLALHPNVAVKASLLQDQLHGDAMATVKKHAGVKALDALKHDALKVNLEYSRGRLKSDWIEPETLFWAAWRALPKKEQGAIAREVVERFVAYVEEAAAADPRGAAGDPMEWHRHRIHPVLWGALPRTRADAGVVAAREHAAFSAREEKYLARRPAFSPVDRKTPWDGA